VLRESRAHHQHALRVAAEVRAQPRQERCQIRAIRYSILPLVRPLHFVVHLKLASGRRTTLSQTVRSGCGQKVRESGRKG
jgi:hypothetical protein